MTSKEKKQILQRYGQIDDHINELQAEVDMWWSRATATSPVLSDMPKGGSADGTKIERAIERIAKIEADIDDEIDELLILKHRIMTAIKELTDLNERRVIYLAYIGKVEYGKYRQLNLWQIAREMNYSYDRIRHIHGAALLHIKL